MPGALRRAVRRSEACTARPRGTGDVGTNIVVTSDAAPRASARDETSSASPGAGGGLAAHRRRRGTMLPTNLCLLTSTYEKTAPRSSPGVDAPGSRRFTDGRPASEDRARVRGRTSDASVTASIVGAPLARNAPSRGGLARRRRDRVTDRAGRASRDAFHPARALAPRRPFGRPARAFHQRNGASRHAAGFATPFHRGEPRGPPRPMPPCTRPVAGGSRFSGLGFACRLLLIGKRRADSPWRAFDPRVASCRDHGASAARRAVDGNDHFRPEPPRRVTRRAMAKRCARAFLDVLRTPGSPGR